MADDLNDLRNRRAELQAALDLEMKRLDPGGEERQTVLNADLAMVEHRIQSRERANRLGCNPFLVLIAFIVGLIAAMIYLTQGRGDDGRTAATAATTVPAPASSSPAISGGDGGDATGSVADYAGRWVLRSGLDDPQGRDVGFPGPEHYSSITILPPSAEITIGSDGTITGGLYRAALTATGGSCPEKTTSESVDYRTATGQVGPDGAGLADWRGTRSSSGCGEPESAAHGVGLYFWITGDEMVLCSAGPMVSPTTCAEGNPVTAVFRRA